MDEDEEWGVLGLSLGGMIAMQWCANYPEDFKKLVVINTSAGGLGGGFVRLTAEAVHTLARAVMIRNPRMKESLVCHLISNLRANDEGVIAAYEKIAIESPIPSSIAASQLTAAARFKAPSSINTSMLVLSADNDRLCPPEFSDLIATKYGAEHLTHPTAGHDLPLDDPSWVIEQVFQFAQK